MANLSNATKQKHKKADCQKKRKWEAETTKERKFIVKDGYRVNVTDSLMADILFIFRPLTKGGSHWSSLWFSSLNRMYTNRENTMLLECMDWRNKKFHKIMADFMTGFLCLWFRASPIYINNCPTRRNTKQSSYYSANSLYMFRVSTRPIIRSTQNCN